MGKILRWCLLVAVGVAVVTGLPDAARHLRNREMSNPRP